MCTPIKLKIILIGSYTGLILHTAHHIHVERYSGMPSLLCAKVAKIIIVYTVNQVSTTACRATSPPSYPDDK